MEAVTLDLQELGIGDCYKEALIRAIRKYKLAHRRMQLQGKDGVWIVLPDGLLERVFDEARACYKEQDQGKKGKKGGKGRPPPLKVVTLA